MKTSPERVSYRYRLYGTVAGKPYSIYLRDGLQRLGRDAANDVVVAAEGVSRCQSLLIVGPEGIEIVDQGSKNGTFVDGCQIDRAKVRGDAALRFGNVELSVVELEPADARLALEVSPCKATEPEETSATAVDTVADCSRWPCVVGRFASALAADSGSSGLEVLLSPHNGLRIDGAAIVRLSGNSEPEVIALCGQVPAAEILKLPRLLEDSTFQGSPPRYFASCPEATVCLLGDGRAGGRALVLTGDFANRDHCSELLTALLEVHTTAREKRRFQGLKEPGELDFPTGFVRGTSPAMIRLYGQLRTAAGSRLPVLVVGETGVGKEYLVHLIHRSSERRTAPLVAVNCAAIPKDLLEAELFGIGERVATGVAGRIGKFREADGGSLFLDEVGDMPAELQSKLLRVLQEGRVAPVGTRPQKVDVRVIAATNTDLERRMEEGRFRRDLYYRLAGFVLEVPPLRQRPDDIPALVEHHLRRASAECSKPIRGLTLGALQRLVAHGWPGNIRELEHLVRRLVHLCPAGQTIDSAWLAEAGLDRAVDVPVEEPVLPAPAPGSIPGHPDPLQYREAPTDLNLERLERVAIAEALDRSEGRLAQAAALLGLTRFSLRRRLERHGLSAPHHCA